MNLRPNLWTVLFLLTAGWFFYTTISGEKPAAAQDITAARTSDSIPAAEALERIARYKHQVDSILTDTARIIGGKTLLEAMNVVAAPIYFKLESNEIQEIAAQWGGQDVYAYLAVKKASGPQNARDTIDLIFMNKDPKDGKAATYYDFSTPCPPVCGGQ